MHTETFTQTDRYRLIFVHDPTDSGNYVIPIGKQTIKPTHIFYTPCSGIWQSVWIEPTPENYIDKFDIDANAKGEGQSVLYRESGGEKKKKA